MAKMTRAEKANKVFQKAYAGYIAKGLSPSMALTETRKGPNNPQKKGLES